MKKQLIDRIQRVLVYIEDNIYEKIEIQSVAKAAFMSQSSFYVIFSGILGVSVKEYIRKRRLSLSGYDLVQTDLSILDIALKYQYNTYESYSRAFKNLFGISPQKYREKKLYTNVFPKITLKYSRFIGGDLMIDKEMNKELIINEIQTHSNGYLLDIDIDHFDDINKNYGYHIGDKVLVEVPQRITRILQQNQLDVEVIRINNDEFTVIIKDKPKAFIEKLSLDIIKVMSKPFMFEDLCIKLTVSIGISDFTVDSSNEEEIIKNANEAMVAAKRNGRNQFVLKE
jgi:AraC family transcriptional regulator